MLLPSETRLIEIYCYISYKYTLRIKSTGLFLYSYLFYSILIFTFSLHEAQNITSYMPYILYFTHINPFLTPFTHLLRLAEAVYHAARFGGSKRGVFYLYKEGRALHRHRSYSYSSKVTKTHIITGYALMFDLWPWTSAEWGEYKGGTSYYITHARVRTYTKYPL